MKRAEHKRWLLATMCLGLMACASGQIRIGGKPVNTNDGAEATHQYYAPQMKRLKKRAEPLPTAAVFAQPNAQFSAANWVKNAGHLTKQQFVFFRDFSLTSWLVLGTALQRGNVFGSFRTTATIDGTSEPAEQSKIEPGTLVISFNAANRVVLYRYPARDQAVEIKEKLTPGHELEMMTNLIVAAAKRLAPDSPTAVTASPPKEAPIVAVFDVQSSRVELVDDLRRSLSNYAATQLAASGRYRVIPRSQIRARLRNQKRASYRSCFDMACQVEIGRELAAQKSLAITVSRIGSRCNISVVLYDLKQAASEKAAVASNACNEDGYLEALKQAVDKLN